MIYGDFSFFARNEKRCFDADRADPCDADTWCIPNVADCPPHIRLDMILPELLPADTPVGRSSHQPGRVGFVGSTLTLTQSQTQMHATFFSKTSAHGGVHPFTVRAPRFAASCGSKRVRPRYQYLFTLCDASSDVGCADRCFTLLVGRQNGLHSGEAREFASRSGIRATVLHLSPIVEDDTYTIHVNANLTHQDTVTAHVWYYEPVAYHPGRGPAMLSCTGDADLHTCVPPCDCMPMSHTSPTDDR